MVRKPANKRAIELATYLTRCALITQGVTTDAMLAIEQTLTNTIGTITIIVNVESNEVYVSGNHWQFIIFPDGAIKLTGSIEQEGETIPVTYRELLALILAASTMGEPIREGAMNLRFYATGAAGEEVQGADNDE